MTVEQTQATMQAYLDALLAGGAFEQFFSDDVQWTTVGYDVELTGREAVGQFIRAFHTQAFAATSEVKNLFVADGKAAIQANFVGQHIAEFMGVAATQRQVNVPYAVIYDLVEDRITVLRSYFPMEILLQQLGATAQPAQAST